MHLNEYIHTIPFLLRIYSLSRMHIQTVFFRRKSKRNVQYETFEKMSHRDVSLQLLARRLFNRNFKEYKYGYINSE